MAKTGKDFKVKIQKEAIDDLDEIHRFIFHDSPTHARKFLTKLKTKILGLRHFPFRGSRVKILEEEGAGIEIRFVEHQGYLIFYCVDGNTVFVLHLAGPGQNWQALFD